MNMVSRVVEVIDGQIGISSREKERDRKDKKDMSPNTPMKWDGRKWKPRKKDTHYYKEKTKGYQKLKEEIEEDIPELETEVSLMEVSIGTLGVLGSLGKIKQYGNRVDRDIQKLRSLGNNLKNAKDEKERNKTVALLTALAT